jgi:hypothetical protein
MRVNRTPKKMPSSPRRRGSSGFKSKAFLTDWIPTKLLNPLSAKANSELPAACAGMMDLP